MDTTTTTLLLPMRSVRLLQLCARMYLDCAHDAHVLGVKSLFTFQKGLKQQQ